MGYERMLTDEWRYGNPLCLQYVRTDKYFSIFFINILKGDCEGFGFLYQYNIFPGQISNRWVQYLEIYSGFTELQAQV